MARNPRLQYCSRPAGYGVIAVKERPISRTLTSAAALDELSEQMGQETCRQFVGTYIQMWNGRFQRLVSALEEPDYAGAMDVVLSIKISSQMAGALRLAGYASIAQDMVRSADHAGLVSLLDPLQSCGQETVRALSESLSRL